MAIFIAVRNFALSTDINASTYYKKARIDTTSADVAVTRI